MNVELKKTGSEVKVISNKRVYHVFNCDSNDMNEVLKQLKREIELYDLDEMFIEDYSTKH